jgi:hypothetical protein
MTGRRRLALQKLSALKKLLRDTQRKQMKYKTTLPKYHISNYIIIFRLVQLVNGCPQLGIRFHPRYK